MYEVVHKGDGEDLVDENKGLIDGLQLVQMLALHRNEGRGGEPNSRGTYRESKSIPNHQMTDAKIIPKGWVQVCFRFHVLPVSPSSSSSLSLKYYIGHSLDFRLACRITFFN